MLAHASSLMSPCFSDPADALESAASTSEGYALTICDRLLITVIPDPKPSISAANKR